MSIRNFFSVSLLGALVALAPLDAKAADPIAPGSAPATPWDQAAVTKLAGELARNCQALYDEFYKMPGSSGGFIADGQAEDTYKLKYKLRRLEEQSQDLAGALAAGKGRAETTPDMEDLGALARDTRVLLSHIYVQSALQARIDTARGSWFALMPYYGIQPPEGIDAPAAKR